MSQVKLDSGLSLRTFLEGVIGKGIKSALAQRALDEKEKQASTAGGGNDVDSLFGGDDHGGTSSADATSSMPDLPDDDDKDASSKTMDDEKEKLAKGDISPKDIVEKLNSIRSGKSFKDSAVSSALDQYIQSLSKPERVAMLAFLRGVAQIVTGEFTGQQAVSPEKHPADIKMDKSNEPHVLHKKPNVIKGSSKHAGAPGTGEAKEKEPGEEDTSAPKQVTPPITPKRRK